MRNIPNSIKTDESANRHEVIKDALDKEKVNSRMMRVEDKSLAAQEEAHPTPNLY